MRQILIALLLILSSNIKAQDYRIDDIRDHLTELSASIPGLSQKLNINIREATLPSFLLAVSEVHKVNITVDPSLSSINVINNFTNVSVSDLLVFLCKEYELNIDFTGNILSVKKFNKPQVIPEVKKLGISYNAAENTLSLNLQNDKLYEAFKKITDESGKNIVFSPGLEDKLLTVYIKNMPFENALDKLAISNNLEVSKTKDNFYLFEPLGESAPAQTGVSGQAPARQPKPVRQRKSSFFFNVLDHDKKLLEVDFENTPIANIIYDIGNELNIDIFISSPLENSGTGTVKAKNITFDQLLNKLFESRTSVQNANIASANASSFPQNEASNMTADGYSYFKNGNIYYFGLRSQLVIRNIKTIPMMHRSIELLSDPAKEGRSAGRVSQNNFSSYNSGSNNDSRSNSSYTQTDNSGNGTFTSNTNKNQGEILNIIPAEVKAGLDIKIDTELNSFIVSGPAENINRFESFIKYIDKEVPVVLIEVMILDINRSSTVETGINAGIGTKPVTTTGTLFPTADINLGAETINNIINHFDGFGSLNIGSVVPNFYLSLKALETNGNINIRSTPRLSTLNGHRASLSIGETTYYVVTNQNFYGSQIPQASEIKNYQPIDAELSLSIRPLVSGDGEITMDIRVVQSSFNGQKIDKDAPPGINSREFTSIIRVKNEDVILLGGLEEKTKNDSGTGVPLLSRIPILKWLFSSRKRADSKKKLSILIKPTTFY